MVSRMGIINDEGLIAAVRSQLDHQDTGVQVIALLALSKISEIDDRSVIALLVARLTVTDFYLRRAALKALRVVAEVGDNHVIAAVLATYRDASRLLQQSLDISTFWAAVEIKFEARQLLLELGAEEEGVESEEKVEAYQHFSMKKRRFQLTSRPSK